MSRQGRTRQLELFRECSRSFGVAAHVVGIVYRFRTGKQQHIQEPEAIPLDGGTRYQIQVYRRLRIRISGGCSNESWETEAEGQVRKVKCGVSLGIMTSHDRLPRSLSMKISAPSSELFIAHQIEFSPFVWGQGLIFPRLNLRLTSASRPECSFSSKNSG